MVGDAGRTGAVGSGRGDAGACTRQRSRTGTRRGRREGRTGAGTRSGGGTLTLTPASRIDAFSLPPGASELRWTATDPTNTSSLAVRWAPAWTAL